MRTFIVLCLVAVACAQYNYQPAGPAAGGNFAGNSDGGFVAPQGDIGGQAAVAPQADFEKEFFTYTANDNDFNDDGANQAANAVKQGVRVIFIKGPENKGLEDAALALAKQAGQQQTAIYVLNKQADIGDLANKLNNLNTGNNNKPEVHFVKYRTPEDAANAQRAIQGQYDGLGGNTRTINGGVAPVLNFASQAPSGPSGSSNYGSGGSIEGPSNSYIPPASVPSAPTNSYIPPAASAPASSYIPPAPAASAPTTSYIPPAASAPASSYIPPAPAASAPSSSYIPPAPAASAPANTYIPPAQVADEPSTNYLPASILRLFRL